MYITSDNGIYVGMPSIKVSVNDDYYTTGTSGTFCSTGWNDDNTAFLISHPDYTLLPVRDKKGYTERCPYCGRKAKDDECICEGCGAPL